MNTPIAGLDVALILLKRQRRRSWPAGALLVVVLMLVALPASAAVASGVEPRLDLADPAGAPFPSDRFTVPDGSQLTGLRVALPKPDCTARPSECDDVDVLNTLDGFNLQPRLSIPFTGAVDLDTVSGETVFLCKLDGPVCPGQDSVVGINQVVWDPDNSVLHAESDRFLDQHAGYLLVVTNDIRDPAGDRIGHDRFSEALHSGSAYTDRLLAATRSLSAAGIAPGHVAAASVFTTQSATPVLEKIRDQLKAATPAAADFLLGTNGERTVFALDDVSRIDFKRQVTTEPRFTTSPMAINLLKAAGGAVGTLAFGRYRSPNYETPARVIPAVGSATGTPTVQDVSDVYFNLVLPAGPRPAPGWPVAIVGHGGRSGHKHIQPPLMVAAALAQRGIASITFNAVGHGGGPLGTLSVTNTGGSTVTLSAGGRSSDDNGDGLIVADEGVSARPGSPQALVSYRDGISQTVIDAMQLVRVIETGIDVDGDSQPDLDPARLYLAGRSLGAIWGADLMALQPRVRAATLAGFGGSLGEFARLGVNRPLIGELLAKRTPSLQNAAPVDPFTNRLFPFDEHLPPRNQPPVINDVPGAIAVQQQLDRLEWAMQASNPVAYAPHLRKDPLPGLSARPVLLMFAKGDKSVPNPAQMAVVRAGALADRTLYFRYDLALANGLPHRPNDDPHDGADVGAIASFLASDGHGELLDPDGSGPIWEAPISTHELTIADANLSFIGPPIFLSDIP